MLDILGLLMGFILMIKGADFFVISASRLAKKLKIAPMVIGLTIVAFGTSAPEAAVSLTASVRGQSMMTLGNIVGSNLFNIVFILGLIALIKPLWVTSTLLKREIPFALLSSVLLMAFYWLFSAHIGRFEGLMLVVLFAVYLGVILAPKEIEKKAIYDEKIPMKPILIYGFLGLVMIIAGGIWTTQSASNLAMMLGMSEWLVGLTILAIGTSLPELMTSVVAVIKKERDLALGNIIGSNIFNIMFILGASSLIRPITFSKTALSDVIILCIISALVYLFSFTNRKIDRLEGLVLLIIYISYMVFIIIRN